MPKAMRRMKLEEVLADFYGVLERVPLEGDGILVERDGELIAAIISVGEYSRLSGGMEPSVSDDVVAKALAAAGVWSDLDTDAMLKAIYEARHLPATRPPVSFDD